MVELTRYRANRAAHIEADRLKITSLQSAQAVINQMAEDIGALQTQIDNALEERDSLLQVAESLQEMVADLNRENAGLQQTLACYVVAATGGYKGATE
jgi:FtsZ-binding cell division protein ZapB